MFLNVFNNFSLTLLTKKYVIVFDYPKCYGDSKLEYDGSMLDYWDLRKSKNLHVLELDLLHLKCYLGFVRLSQTVHWCC